MSEVRISDVVVPELFTRYLFENVATKSNILRSGLAVRVPQYDAGVAEGGSTWNMPFWGDLTGDDEVLSDSAALSINNIASGSQIAAKLFRGKSWGSNDLAAALAGDDPFQHILTRVSDFWDRKMQVSMINVLNGLFEPSGCLATTHKSNLAKESDAASGYPVNFAATDFINATQLLGDTMDDLDVVCVHSKIYAGMKIANLIDYIEPADGGKPIPQYQGLTLVVDDGCPVRAGNLSGNTSGQVYTSYAFKRGAFGLGVARPKGFTPTELDRHATAGYDVIVSRMAYSIHPMGIKWSPESGVPAGVSPSNAELAGVGNWAKAFTDDKNIRIVAITTNEG